MGFRPRFRERTSPPHPSGLPRSPLLLALVIALAGWSMSSLGDSVTWDGGAGTEFWHDVANWSTDRLPGRDDDVSLGSARVTLSQGDYEVRTLTASSFFTVNGGRLKTSVSGTFTGGLTLIQGNLTGATLTVNGGSFSSHETFQEEVRLLVRPEKVTLLGNLGPKVQLVIYSYNGGGQSIMEIPPGISATNRGTIALAGAENGIVILQTGATVGDKTSELVNEGDLAIRSSLGCYVTARVMNHGSITATTGSSGVFRGPIINRGGRISSEGNGSLILESGGLQWESGTEINGSIRMTGGALDVTGEIDLPSRLLVYGSAAVEFHNNLATNLAVLVYSYANGGNALLTVPPQTIATNRGTLMLSGVENGTATLQTAVTVNGRASELVNEGTVTAQTSGPNYIDARIVNFGTITSRTGCNARFSQPIVNFAGTIRSEGNGFLTIAAGGLTWKGGTQISGSVFFTGGSLEVLDQVDEPSLVYVYGNAAVQLLNNLATNLAVHVYSYANGGNALLTVPPQTIATNRGTLMLSGVENGTATLQTAVTVNGRASELVNEGTVTAQTSGPNYIDARIVNFGTITSRTGCNARFSQPIVNFAGTIRSEGNGFLTIAAGGLTWKGGTQISGSVFFTGGSLEVLDQVDEPSLVYVYGNAAVQLLNNLATNLAVHVYSYANGGNALLTIPPQTSATNRGTLLLRGVENGTATVQTSPTVNGVVSELVNQGTILPRANGYIAIRARIVNEGALIATDATSVELTGPFFHRAGTIRTLGDGRLQFSGSVEIEGGSWSGESSRGIDITGPSLRWLGGQISSGVTLTTGSLFVGEGVTEPSDLALQGSHTFLGNESPAARLLLVGSNPSLQVPAGLPSLNRGTLRFASEASLAIADTASFANLGRLEIAANSSIQGNWDNLGLVHLDAANLSLAANAHRVRNYGQIRVERANLSLAGTTLQNYPGARISASGALDVASGQFLHEGELDPLPARSGLVIKGDFLPFPSATLFVDIDAYQAALDLGFTPGTTFDLLTVTGRAVLDGGLQVAFTRHPDLGTPVYPPLDTRLSILSAAALQGQFVRTSTLQLTADRSLVPEFTATTVHLVTRSANNARPLVITRHPESQRVSRHAPFSLSAHTEGTPPLFFQWYLNGNPIPGATSDQYSVGEATLAHAGTYTVLVANGTETVMSQPAEIGLELAPLYLTDDFSRRLTYDDLAFAGATNNSSATPENGEPPHAGRPGGKSLWMSWRSPTDGIATFTTAGSSFDTVLAVYQGDTLARLADSEIARDDDSGGFLTSRVSFQARANQSYQIAVDGYAGATGEVLLEWSVRTDGTIIPTFVQHPLGTLATVGSPVVLEGAARGERLSYQWYRHGQPLAGATASQLILPNVGASDVGTYVLGVRSAFGPEIRSDQALVQVLLEGQAEVGFQDKLEESFDTISADTPADLQGFADHAARLHSGTADDPARAGGIGSGPFASIVMGLPGTLIGDNARATRQEGEPSLCEFEADDATLWWRLRPLASGRLLLHTGGSEVDTVISIYRRVPSLVRLGCSADDNPVDGTSRLEVEVLAGQDYLVQVDTVAGRGRVQLHWALGAGAVEETFRLEVQLAEGDLRLGATVNPGRYRLEVSPDLLTWTAAAEVSAVANRVAHRESAIHANSHRFYRLVKLP